ncbi:hypothetical protein Ddc_19216 [Ditylenchus destructor]|nr:hypothetical protein Ddc_19216 [Ditylenchus destructor]
MSEIVPSQSVKRPGSPISNASGSGAKKRCREKVHILDDAWFEALKFLTCPQWSKMRLASGQLKGFIERNVARLPMAVVSAEMRRERREQSEIKMIVSDTTISPDDKDQWFKDRGITIDVPAGIQLNAITGVELQSSSCIDFCVFGFGKELFYAEFSPDRNRFSWASISFFLKLIYDQSTFVEELSMYPLDKQLKNILFADEEKRYIRCGDLTFQMYTDPSSKELCESLLWLEQNVQANKIEIPTLIDYDDNEVCDAMSNFLLNKSWISASHEVNLEHVNELENFFRALIKKFRTLATVQSKLPIITLRGLRFLGSTGDVNLKCLLLGKEELEASEKEELQEEYNKVMQYFYSEGEEMEKLRNDKIGKTYTISNGANQMQIEFVYIFPKPNTAFKCSGRRRGKPARHRISSIFQDKNRMREAIKIPKDLNFSVDPGFDPTVVLGKNIEIHHKSTRIQTDIDKARVGEISIGKFGLYFGSVFSNFETIDYVHPDKE